MDDFTTPLNIITIIAGSITVYNGIQVGGGLGALFVGLGAAFVALGILLMVAFQMEIAWIYPLFLVAFAIWFITSPYK